MADPKDEDEYLKPAIEGTLSVLWAAWKHRVKWVVSTSSTAAIADWTKTGITVTEDDWVEIHDKLPIYNKSKILAEWAAWDYVNELPEDEKFDLVVINPSGIIGPTLTREPFESGNLLIKLLDGSMSRVPFMHLPFVDVRDVAEAHVLALTTSGVNQRFLLANGTMTMVEAAETLNEEFGKYGYAIPTKQLSYPIAWAASFFVPL